MGTNLEGIANKLIVVPDGLLATVNPEVAGVIFDAIELRQKPDHFLPDDLGVLRIEYESTCPFPKAEGLKHVRNIEVNLADDMIYGISGALGYSQLVMQNDFPNIVGIVHVPLKIIRIVSALGGISGESRFLEFFGSEIGGEKWKGRRWNLLAHDTNISNEVLSQVPFLEADYQWMMVQTPVNLCYTKKTTTRAIGDVQNKIATYMRQLDEHVLRMTRQDPNALVTPEIAAERFSSAQVPKQLYIGP